MTLVETVLLAGVVLAVLGAISVVTDAAYAGGEPRFVAYLVAMLLALAGVGMLLMAV